MYIYIYIYMNTQLNYVDDISIDYIYIIDDYCLYKS